MTTLVLSGAGAKGYGTLGAVKLLEEKCLVNNVTKYWGTSIGSMIIYLLSLGYKSIEILQILLNNDVNTVISCDIKHLNEFGLISIDKFTSIIKEISIEKFGFVPTFKQHFEKYGKILNIIATNVTIAKCIVFNTETHPEMSVIEAIELSCSLPAIFTKKYYQGDWYVDGGFSNNYAIDLADPGPGPTLGPSVYGVYVNSINENVPPGGALGAWAEIELLYNLLNIPLLELNRQKIKKCSENVINIELNINNILLTTFFPVRKKKIETFSLGYQQTKNFFEKLDPNNWMADF